MSRRLLRLALVSTAAAGLMMSAAPAFASTTSGPTSKDIIYTWEWVTTGHSYTGNSIGTWQQCGIVRASPAPSHLACGETTGYQVSFSATVGGTDKVGDGSLSAQVGFNVTESYTKSVTYTVDVPAHKQITVWTAPEWKNYSVTQKYCQVAVAGGGIVQCSGSPVTATTHNYAGYMNYKNTSP
jgi:hypothetical protein